MKKKTIIFFVLFTGIFSFAFSQTSLTGAWELKHADQSTILLFQDGYFTSSQYTSDQFGQTWGGPFEISENKIKILVEFDSADSTTIGQEKVIDFSIKNKQLTIDLPAIKSVYQLLDNGKAPLAGTWKITEREQDGKLVRIHQRGTRKTLKMLTGTRFQWFAIDPGTKQFSGTGGGTYTFKNGKYTEHILFFSRDNSRVGADLTFDGKIEGGRWHHSGLSSKGDKIYEIWDRIGGK